MRKELDHDQMLLRQYRLLPELLRVPAESEEAMEVLGAILGRDELEEQENPRLKRSLGDSDRAFAAALASSDNGWWSCILKWSVDCGFESSAWWQSVLTIARQLAGGRDFGLVFGALAGPSPEGR